MTKTEVQLIEDLRSQGRNWEEVGLTFGLSDEACRSAWRRVKAKEVVYDVGLCPMCRNRLFKVLKDEN